MIGKSFERHLKNIDYACNGLLRIRGGVYPETKPKKYYLAGAELKIYRVLDNIDELRRYDTATPNEDTLLDAINYLKLILIRYRRDK